MKKFLFLPLFFLLSLVAGEAFAGGIGSLITGGGGKLFVTVLTSLGFGENGFCWFCPIFEVLFNAMNTLATQVATNLKNVFIATLGVGLIFFIAFKVGATVVRLQEVDLMQFMGELFKHIGRAIIAVAFLAGTIQIYQYVISPFLEYSFVLSLRLLSDTNNLGGEIMSAGASVIKSFSTSSICENMNQLGNTSNGMAFSNGLLYTMKCMLGQVSASLIMGMIIGGVIFLLAFVDLIFGLLPNVVYLTVGSIIFGSYFVIYISVPFKLIDAMVRLSFVCALTPIWIILWIFPQTIQYTKNAWEMLLNCCLTFICLSVMLVLVFPVLGYMLPNKYQLLEYMIIGLDAEAAKNLSLVSTDILLTGALGLLCLNMIGAASILAQQIVKSYSTNVGAGLEKQMVQGLSAIGGPIAGFAAAGAAYMYGGVSASIKHSNDIIKEYKNNQENNNQEDNSQKPRTPETFTDKSKK